MDKHWFVVRDTSMKTERLLTLVPLSSNCAIECNPSTRGTILELFLALQHPYIYPVLDLDFRDVSGQTYVVLVLPFNNKGSLKDLIYKVRIVRACGMVPLVKPLRITWTNAQATLIW